MNAEETQVSINFIKLLERPNRNYSVLSKQSESVSVTQTRFKQLQIAETLVFILAFTGFGVSAIISDVLFNEDSKDNVIVLYLEIISSVSTALLILSIYYRMKQEFLWEQAKGIYSYMDTISSTGKMNYFYIEFALNIVHTPIILKFQSFSSYNSILETDIVYRYSTIVVAFMVVRVYHLIRLFSIFSAYRSCRSQRLCQLNGSHAGTYYAVKCMMQENPLIVMIWMLLSGIFVFGFLLRLFERPIASLTEADLNDYGNAMWCIITTMTTVGYGDYFPVTVPGRICGCIACIWGVLVISLMCCSLVNLLMLDTGEGNSLLILHRLWYKNQMKQIAAFVLTSVYRYRLLIKHKKNVTELELSVQLGKVRTYIVEFQRCRDKQRTLYNYDSHHEIIEYKLDDILDLQKSNDSYLVIDEMTEKLRINMKSIENI